MSDRKEAHAGTTLARAIGRAVCVAGAALVSGCGLPSSMESREIAGMVVDANTRKPLAGVLVEAQWFAEITYMWGSQHATCYHIEAAITDGAGRYRLAGWHFDNTRQKLAPTKRASLAGNPRQYAGSMNCPYPAIELEAEKAMRTDAETLAAALAEKSNASVK